jgi:glycosyltransferase involved in cell wall biosynthesis
LPAAIAADGLPDITPNVLLEAMALGLPVISTAIAAIPEIVEDGVSGLLVPPGDPAALVAAVERLIADPDLGARLGANTRRRIAERFDLAAKVRAYAALFTGADLVSASPP